MVELALFKEKKKIKLILVSGPAGAGRTTAIRSLEDFGFEAIDNLPLDLVKSVLKPKKASSKIAIGLDTRGRDFSVEGLLDLLNSLSSLEHVDFELLYLSCTMEVLLRRYSETRRRHPLADGKAPHAAIEQGAQVTLISGPVNIEPPSNCNLIAINTAKEMSDAVKHHIKEMDVYIGTAAVSDYSPAEVKDSKIKKAGDNSSMTLELKENEDILKFVSELEDRPYVVGFAAETDKLIENAENKLKHKKLDLIVANDVSDKSIGFDSEENEVTLITKEEK